MRGSRKIAASRHRHIEVHSEPEPEFFVAFKRPENSWVESLIAFFDQRGQFCHTEIAWPPTAAGRDKAFAAHSNTGCDWRFDVDYRPDRWTLLKVRLDKTALESACEMANGDGYDFMGIFRFLARWAISFLPQRLQSLIRRFWKFPWRPSEGRWFCSELAAKLLTVSGGPKFARDYLIGPNELFAALSKNPPA
jgi:hypothetical protein